ncbi:PhzF family phenazine biosynthesis protein [Primorskyibacter aestuariivivens]|uniref:PhzF family phenazine biosynthesis protein n=1 Tax=Primorskyibacter aestuariivivens TaxID=1888912 RepID=UPI0023014278|nr:PhzF family phenazine biosynthesis protein [Primorskyibacter aestuariivivens]MDA7428165.1 PhzF family phenazine biosynthesis protein [Primorskyibacter aestuariivivens]
MTEFAVDWVDAFTDQPFGGNGCAVVQDAAHLDDETCMRFVRETSLVECTFLGPSDVAEVRVRYFLASGEIPFAGHPTVASVAALRHRGFAPGDSLTLETGAGIVPVEIGTGDAPWITMTQVAPSFGDTVLHEFVAHVVGLAPDDLISEPQITSTGLPFVIALVKDLETLVRARLDLDALDEMARVTGARGPDMLEPYLITREGWTDGGDTFARLMLAPPSPPEDPFTGSATGAAAAYLWHHSLIDSPRYVAEQGHGMGRPGQARVEVLGPREVITGVKVSGQAHVLMSGSLYL